MISVVIATYNQKLSLKWLLTSLEQQDCKEPFEVLVCDDGSSENIFSLMVEFGKRGKLDLRYLWQPHVGNGVTRSRNNGIRCARGEILIFADSDCLVPKNWISAHAKAHRGAGKRGKKIVAGTRAWVDVSRAELTRTATLSQLSRMSEKRRRYPDREKQIELSHGKLPWAACWSFNFSLPNTPEVRFDETITSWGNDDYELCCRLFHEYEYTPVLKPEIEVIHFALPRLGSGWNPWVSGKHEHIERYVRSLIELTRKFPRLDLSEALWPLHYFLLDQKTGKWRKSLPGEKISLPRALAIAENYVRETRGETE